MMHINRPDYNDLPEDVQIKISEDDAIIDDLIRELNDTDYIIIKIAEAEALGDHTKAEQIRKDHAADIERRIALRRQINTIKEKWEGTN